jgi:hypothetical protein
MPVYFLSETSQQEILSSYNQTKRKFEKIPLLARNANTGWPLLQVSMYSPLEADPQKFEPVVGGGTCHSFMTAAFNFACLLTNIPGVMIIQAGRRGENKEKKHLKADNVAMFIDGFRVEHRNLEIKISSVAGIYGKNLEIECGHGNTDKLNDALWEGFDFSLKPGAVIHNFGSYWDEYFTAQAIKAGINDAVAVFSEGQIFVDIGKLFDEYAVDPNIISFFERVFQVEAFRALQIEQSALQAQEIVEIIEEVDESQSIAASSSQCVPINPAMHATLPTQGMDGAISQSAFSSLREKIRLLDALGESLLDKDADKAQAAKAHATSLTQSVDTFERGLGNNKPNSTQIQQFQSEFKTLLHSKDKEMKEHRAIWKPIIANIAWCVATLGIGLFIIAGRAGWNTIDACRNNKSLAASDLIFFAQTNREKRIDSIEQALDSLGAPEYR